MVRHIFPEWDTNGETKAMPLHERGRSKRFLSSVQYKIKHLGVESVQVNLEIFPTESQYFVREILHVQ